MARGGWLAAVVGANLFLPGLIAGFGQCLDLGMKGVEGLSSIGPTSGLGDSGLKITLDILLPKLLQLSTYAGVPPQIPCAPVA